MSLRQIKARLVPSKNVEPGSALATNTASGASTFSSAITNAIRNEEVKNAKLRQNTLAANDFGLQQSASDRPVGNQRVSEKLASNQRMADQIAANQHLSDQLAANHRASEQRIANQRASDKRIASSDQRTAAAVSDLDEARLQFDAATRLHTFNVANMEKEMETKQDMVVKMRSEIEGLRASELLFKQRVIDANQQISTSDKALSDTRDELASAHRKHEFTVEAFQKKIEMKSCELSSSSQENKNLDTKCVELEQSITALNGEINQLKANALETEAMHKENNEQLSQKYTSAMNKLASLNAENIQSKAAALQLTAVEAVQSEAAVVEAVQSEAADVGALPLLTVANSNLGVSKYKTASVHSVLMNDQVKAFNAVSGVPINPKGDAENAVVATDLYISQVGRDIYHSMCARSKNSELVDKTLALMG